VLVALNVVLDRLAAAAGLPPPGDAAGLLGYTGLPGWANVVVVVVALDGLAYLGHVLMHKLSPAWRFHRVRHSDAHVDVTTAFRQHPLETLWRYSFVCAGALALGASTWSVARRSPASGSPAAWTTTMRRTSSAPSGCWLCRLCQGPSVRMAALTESS